MIDEALFESSVDDNGELSCGGGDGLGFANAIGEASIVGADRRFYPPESESEGPGFPCGERGEDRF